MRAVDEVIVHGCLIVALCVSGFMRGFDFAIVGGILGILLIHYRTDLLPRKPVDSKQDIPATIEFEMEKMKEKLNQLNAILAFRGAASKPKQPEAQAPK